MEPLTYIMVIFSDDGFRKTINVSNNLFLLIILLGKYFVDFPSVSTVSSGISWTQNPASQDKKNGLGRMVLLRDDSTDARFFRREASQNFLFISHRVFGEFARQLFPIIGVYFRTSHA